MTLRSLRDSVAVLSRRIRRRVKATTRTVRRRPRRGHVDFGDLGGTAPISRTFGYDRGAPIDRWYIEGFLAEHSPDIRGRVLEVAERTYTQRFGGERVTKSEVLHVEEGHDATIVGDLSTGSGIPVAAFDAILLTQTLHCIYEVRSAIAVLHRALVPGGVLLVTAPGISQLSRYDADRWGEFWRFTRHSLERLLAEQFGATNVHVGTHGNVKAAIAMLNGLAQEDLLSRDLEATDPDYELVLTARAVRQ